MYKFITFLLVAGASITLAASPTAAAKPTSPTEFLAVKSLQIPGAIELSWHAVKGVSEYTVSASRETAENWHSLGTTSATSFQVNELPEGTKYYFRIASNSPSGQSEWSGAVVQYSSQTKDFRPALRLPANFLVNTSGPVARSAMPGRKGELALVWNVVAGAKSYVVQICEAEQCGPPRTEAGIYRKPSQNESFHDLKTVQGTEYLVTGLLSGKMYLFRILGIDDKGNRGDYSVVQGRRAP